MIKSDNLYQQRLANLQKELEQLSDKKVKTNEEIDKIDILKAQVKELKGLIELKESYYKLKHSDIDNKKEKLNEIKKQYLNLKSQMYRENNLGHVFSCLVSQMDKYLSNFLNQSYFVYKLRKENYNFRYNNRKVNFIIKTVLSVVTIAMGAPFVGAVFLAVTVYNTLGTYIEKNKLPYVREKKILNGTYMDNLTNSIYAYIKCRSLFVKEKETEKSAETSHIYQEDISHQGEEKVDSDDKRNDVFKSLDLNYSTDSSRKEILNSLNFDKSDDSCSKTLDSLDFSTNTDLKQEKSKNTKEEINYSQNMYDNLILRVKIFNVVDGNNQIIRQILNCRFYLKNRKINQFDMDLKDVTTSTNIDDISQALMNVFPYLKRKPEVSYSKANIINKEKFYDNTHKK